MKRQQLTMRRRFEILKRDGFACQYCGARAPQIILNVDHIMPLAKHGDNSDGNMITACQRCNGGKSDYLLPGFQILAAEPRMISKLKLCEEDIRTIEKYAARAYMASAERSREWQEEWYKRKHPGEKIPKFILFRWTELLELSETEKEDESDQNFQFCLGIAYGLYAAGGTEQMGQLWDILYDRGSHDARIAMQDAFEGIGGWIM